MIHLFDGELSSSFPHLMFNECNDMFDNDKELRELHQQRRQITTEMDNKIRDRRKLLLQEHETAHPARYSRKYSSSYSNMNGKEKTETSDVVEENEDGAKTIHEKADTVEKDNGTVVDEEHVNVKLAQDKDDKNKWKVEHNGKTIVLDATDKDFGKKMQELTTSAGKTQSDDENDWEEPDVDDGEEPKDLLLSPASKGKESVSIAPAKRQSVKATRGRQNKSSGQTAKKRAAKKSNSKRKSKRKRKSKTGK